MRARVWELGTCLLSPSLRLFLSGLVVASTLPRPSSARTTSEGNASGQHVMPFSASKASAPRAERNGSFLFPPAPTSTVAVGGSIWSRGPNIRFLGGRRDWLDGGSRTARWQGKARRAGLDKVVRERVSDGRHRYRSVEWLDSRRWMPQVGFPFFWAVEKTNPGWSVFIFHFLHFPSFSHFSRLPHPTPYQLRVRRAHGAAADILSHCHRRDVWTTAKRRRR